MNIKSDLQYLPPNTTELVGPDGSKILFIQGPVERQQIPEITCFGVIRGGATLPEWKRMSNFEKSVYVKAVLDDRHAIKIRNGVTLYFMTPECVEDALKLKSDSERLAFFNRNVICIDPGEPLDLEVR
jgi:hypothetical protein